jgi:gluconate kinase
MIYVLFGPPGVGKTYIGGSLAKHWDCSFLDADVLYDDDLKSLLQDGTYNQIDRDKFIEKLMITVDNLRASGSKDLVIAEAFTKEKNRAEFLRHFGGEIRYVMIRADRGVAHNRMMDRMKREHHVVNEKVFEFIWDEFEAPTIPHTLIHNMNKSMFEILEEFDTLRDNY